jgi:hypothetical protein
MSLTSKLTRIRDVTDSCTLPTLERPLRAAEFDAVFQGTVLTERVSDTHLRIGLTGPDGLPERLRDLTERETECCSFFSFTVSEEAPDRAVLDVEVSAGHVAVLDSMEARATKASSRATRP